MPNQLTSAGLEIKTVSEISSELAVELQAIYGADINVDQNSPDGQLINIFAQAAEDILELLMAVYNTFSVDASFGIYLDQRVALNGISRRAGTYTVTEVSVVVASALNLIGVDELETDPNATVYTLSDDAGNNYQLLESISLPSANTYTLNFRASDVGDIQPIPNTITNQVTVVLGVTSVNNPSPATSIGVNEETDAELKVRHTKSFYLAATGPADAIEAALLNIPDVTDAFIFENTTNSPVSGAGAHSIWAIVEGGTDAEIGNAIYSKKAPGCGMTGGESYVVTRPNGTNFTALFDRSLNEDLYIKFTINPKVPGLSFDTDAIKDELVTALQYKLNQSPNIGDIIIAMEAIEPRSYQTELGVSSNGITYDDSISPSTLQHKFVLDSSRIDITVP